MNKLIKTLLFTLLTGCASTPQAGSLVEVTVTNQTTSAQLPIYWHQGKRYIAGSPGDRYAVSIRNKTSGRVLTVLSVDGVNAISGETAAVNQAGYVLDPFAAADISGWRKSMSDVAAFVFTALPDSYAARTGRPDNVGVLGVAVYREQPAPRYAPAPQSMAPMEEERAADSAGMMRERSSPELARKENKLGTGHGERRHEPVVYTEFKKESNTPYETISIFYDSRANLIAMGVLPRKTKCLPTPKPFPVSARFVPDPY